MTVEGREAEMQRGTSPLRNEEGEGTGVVVISFSHCCDQILKGGRIYLGPCLNVSLYHRWEGMAVEAVGTS